MDFSHSSVSVSGSLSELGDHRHSRMPGLSSPTGIGIGMLSHLPVGDPYNKQCRPASEMDLDERSRGPIKIARTDSFSCRQQQQHHNSSNGNNNSAAAIGSLLRSNSIMSDGRLTNCSPTNSSASDGGGLISNEGCVNVSEQRLMRSDSGVSVYGGGGGARTLSFHQSYNCNKPAGLPLGMARENGASHMGGMHGIIAGTRPPFTQSQWQELEHQALIFKYMMAGVPVPAELILPIRKSVAALSVLSAGSYHPSMAWSHFQLGFASNTDPEPGRCRRTDGKKWRCSRDVVPDQKYCERHMHRGRHRSRKPVEGQTAAPNSQSHLGGPTPTITTATTTNTITSNGPSPSSISIATARNTNIHTSNLRPPVTVNSHHQQQQSPLGMNSNLLLQIASGSASSMGSDKEYRYMNGMKGGDIDEQVFFSDVSGSTRGLGQDSILSSVSNNGWRSSMQSKVSQVKTEQNGSFMQYNSPQLRTLLGQDFSLMSDASQQMQQQHSFRNSGFGVVESGNVGRESEGQGQPLRHFFDDWPRSRDASTLSWSDVEEDRSNRSSSTTQLSISIPMASSDFSATNSSSPRGKLSLSPLKLSMSRDHDDDDDDTHMGLGVGNIINEEERHRHSNWIPITWESPVGGPLAEVLQSTSECKNASSGLQHNFMNGTADHGWECSPRDSQNNNNSLSHNNDIAVSSSPTGVLQKTFVSLSDSTSTGSSPRSAAPPKTIQSSILLA